MKVTIRLAVITTTPLQNMGAIAVDTQTIEVEIGDGLPLTETPLVDFLTYRQLMAFEHNRLHLESIQMKLIPYKEAFEAGGLHMIAMGMREVGIEPSIRKALYLGLADSIVDTLKDN